jgi:hypothetical protein
VFLENDMRQLVWKSVVMSCHKSDTQKTEHMSFSPFPCKMI